VPYIVIADGNVACSAIDNLQRTSSAAIIILDMCNVAALSQEWQRANVCVVLISRHRGQIVPCSIAADSQMVCCQRLTRRCGFCSQKKSELSLL
jgi:hypothetical protein